MSIIEDIYYGQNYEYEQPINKELTCLEQDAYEQMEHDLTPEELKVVEKYIDKLADYYEKLCALRYKQGFKAGVKLIFECMQKDI